MSLELNLNPTLLPQLGLNPKQMEAVQYFAGPLLILAGAGTGKTKTLTSKIALLIASGVSPTQILAITFTNKAAQEMVQRVGKLVPYSGGMWIHTFHALGARVLRAHGRLIGVKPDFVIYDADDQKKLIGLAMDELGLEAEKNKAALYLSIISRAKDDLLDSQSYLINAQAVNDPARLKAAQIYHRYQKKLTEAGALDFGDLIVRMVELLKEKEEIREYFQENFQYILVDEYQDTNHAQYVLIKTLSAKHRNLCVVGDPDQCLPPGSKIRTEAGEKRVESIREGDTVISASGWGKAAPGKVNKVTKRTYSGELIEIKTKGGRKLVCTPNHICFARLDPFAGAHYVYLMHRRDKGYRLGVTSGSRSSKDNAHLNGLMVRTNQEVADAMWIIKTCASAAEARYYEHFLSVTYGLPTMVFHVRGRRMAVGQDLIDRLYREINTGKAAEKIMEDFGLSPDFPHHRPYAVTRGGFNRKYVWFTVFGDCREKLSDKSHYHRVQLVTSGEELRNKAGEKFNVRPDKKTTWRIETSRKDYDEALKLASDISDLDGLAVISRAKLTDGKPFHFMPASHIQPGMKLPVLESGKIIEDAVTGIKSRRYNGPVFDLSVPGGRNFASGGIVVHNSVYGWRGADIRNIMDFEKDFNDAFTVVLEQNYRSTARILHAANEVIKHNKNRRPKNLWTKADQGEAPVVLEYANETDEARGITDEIKRLTGRGGLTYNDIAVFYRTNAQSRSFEESCRRSRIPYRLIGSVRFYDRKEVKDVLAYLKLLVNPADTISLLRVVNLPARGVGKTALDHVMAYARQKEMPLYDALLSSEQVPDITNTARRGIKEFLDLLEGVKTDLFSATPSSMLANILERSGYWKMTEELAEKEPQESLARLGNLQELVNAVKEFEEHCVKEGAAPTMHKYLEEVMLSSQVDKLNTDTHAVTLMTVHLAKGLEFPAVFLTGLEENLFPINAGNSSEEEMEEERRLAYVGMTRARERLFLTWAGTRRIFGTTYPNLASRFIFESKVARETAVRAGEEDVQVISSYQPPPAMPRIGKGRRIMHPVHGPGRVVDQIGAGELAKVTVVFDSGVRQTFMLKYAPLQPI
ncbi:MAG TPA: ATP-dependent DNA helicase PcrA [Elusimicrobia bacterium]|nr:ATP-dependent DNA helicase PcrA [Elusimicrobiota bacterium]